MRLRTDSAHIAGWRRAFDHDALPRMHDQGAEHDWSWRAKDGQPETPAAEPGDVWVMGDGSGYCFTCPRENCPSGVHCWDHAYDCQRKTDPTHHGCWTWTGSIEGGDLTASPSLQVMTEINGTPTGACGFHGFMRNGVLSE